MDTMVLLTDWIEKTYGTNYQISNFCGNQIILGGTIELLDMVTNYLDCKIVGVKGDVRLGPDGYHGPIFRLNLANIHNKLLILQFL